LGDFFNNQGDDETTKMRERERAREYASREYEYTQEGEVLFEIWGKHRTKW